MQVKRMRVIECTLKKENNVKDYKLEILYKAMHTECMERGR